MVVKFSCDLKVLVCQVVRAAWFRVQKGNHRARVVKRFEVAGE